MSVSSLCVVVINLVARSFVCRQVNEGGYEIRFVHLLRIAIHHEAIALICNAECFSKRFSCLHHLPD